MRIPPPFVLLTRIWPPMLATLADAADVGSAYDVLELKYDGFRALAGVAGGEVALQSRNALDLSVRFGGIAQALRRLRKHEVVLDGELVAHHGRSFHSLQMGSSDVDYVVFDILWLDGDDLRGLPLEERRERLEKVLKNAGPRLRLAERLPTPIAKALAKSKRLGAEGVVCKRSVSLYHGARHRDWLKVKVSHADEFYIVGFTPMSNGAPQIGALLLATMDRTPRYAGKVGTGFSTSVRTQLYRSLSRLKTATPPCRDAPRVRDATWCRPVRVAEVVFTEVTPDGRLRHPSFQRLREDKEHHANPS